MRTRHSGWLLILAVTAVSAASLLDIAAYAYRRQAAPVARPVVAYDPEAALRDHLQEMTLLSIAQEKRIISRNLLPGQNIMDQPCESLGIAMNPLATVSERCEELRLFMAQMSSWEFSHDRCSQMLNGPYGWAGPVPSSGMVQVIR